MTALAPPAPLARAGAWPLPEPPAPTPVAGSAERDPRTTGRILVATLWLCVLTEKVALPGNVEVTLPILWGLIAFLLATGRATIAPWRLIGFTGLALAMAVGQAALAGERPFSIQAMLLSLALYGIFVVAVPLDRAEVLRLVRRFQWLALFIAAMVGIDWAAQLAGGAMPSLEAIIPEGSRYQFYNYVQALAWGAAYMKPNGLFMLETSHTSQLLAMALVFEICLFRRWWTMLVLACAQLSTFGGTGIVLLLCCIPAMPFYVRGRTLALVVGLALLVAAGASQTPVWKNFAARTAELQPGAGPSSGNGRFIEPYQFMAATMSRDVPTLLAGIGPGNAKGSDDISKQMVTNPLVKSVTEYGLITGLLWMLFVHASVIRSRAPGIVALAVLVQYDFLNGALLIPIHVAYCYLLAGMFARVPDTAA